MLKGWDRFCLYNIKIRRHCQLYVKLLFKLFKGYSWKKFIDWNQTEDFHIQRCPRKSNSCNHFLEPCSRDPWVGSSGVWLSAASKSPPRPGLASPGGAGCRNAARRRGEERGARQLQHQMSPLIKLPLTRNRNMPFKFKQQITPPAFHLHNC